MYLYVCKQQSTIAIVLFLLRNANMQRCLWEKSPISVRFREADSIGTSATPLSQYTPCLQYYTLITLAWFLSMRFFLFPCHVLQ